MVIPDPLASDPGVTSDNGRFEHAHPTEFIDTREGLPLRLFLTNRGCPTGRASIILTFSRLFLRLR